jgi:hypothetical protein
MTDGVDVCLVSLLKTLLLPLSSSPPDESLRNLDLVLPDRVMLFSVLYMGIFFGAGDGSRGLKDERYGATGYQRRTHDDEHA